MPGQPPANVEYRRRKETPFCTLQIPTSRPLSETPIRVATVPLLRFGNGFSGEIGRPGPAGGNYSSMIPLFIPMVAACVRSLAPNLERMLLTRLLTVSSVIES